MVDNARILNEVEDFIQELRRASGFNLLEDTNTYVFFWSRNHGDCYECGRPAAFKLLGYSGTDESSWLRCAVCAANAAAEGETIARIEELE